MTALEDFSQRGSVRTGSPTVPGRAVQPRTPVSEPQFATATRDGTISSLASSWVQEWSAATN